MTGTAWAPKCHIIARLRIKTFDGFFKPSSFIFSSPECHFLGKTHPPTPTPDQQCVLTLGSMGDGMLPVSYQELSASVAFLLVCGVTY
jgi:hypothetical protein